MQIKIGLLNAAVTFKSFRNFMVSISIDRTSVSESVAIYAIRSSVSHQDHFMCGVTAGRHDNASFGHYMLSNASGRFVFKHQPRDAGWSAKVLAMCNATK